MKTSSKEQIKADLCINGSTVVHSPFAASPSGILLAGLFLQASLMPAQRM